MRAQMNLIAAVGVVIACISIVYWFAVGSSEEVTPSPISLGAVYAGEPLSSVYRNTELGFSLEMPQGFRSQELPVDDDGGRTILLQNDVGEGIQIYAVPYSEDVTSLSAEDIRAALPDLRVTEEQRVEIGENNSGVAFKSDNEAFSGDSREVWFVFRGTLYQISTYARLDGLLQAMFATWKFF